MSLNSIREAIEQEFVDNFSDPTIVRFQNINFDESSKTTWVDFNITFRDSENAALGGSAPNGIDVRRNGAVLADVYVAPKSGTKDAMTLIDEITTLFENTQIGRIQLLASSWREIGQLKTAGDDPIWFVYRVRTEFYKYE